MKNLLDFTLAICLLCFFTNCSPRQISKTYDLSKIQHIYIVSVGDAAKPQPWEISRNLISIKKENTNLVWKEIKGESYLLVSSWKTDTTHYKNDPKSGFYNTYKYPIWVTVAPEVQNICQAKKFGRKEGLDLRLKQLFGLPPNVEKNYFVEFWVKPQDLFRPCPDSEIADISCGLAFPENVSDEHKKWINNQRLESYYNRTWDKNYPWTQLGYTYDWHPKNKKHRGLSEFVIGANRDVIVNHVYTTAEYCEEHKGFTKDHRE